MNTSRPSVSDALRMWLAWILATVLAFVVDWRAGIISLLVGLLAVVVIAMGSASVVSRRPDLGDDELEF